MIKQFHVFQHVPFEGPGAVAEWARERDLRVAIYHLYAGERPERCGAGDVLCVLGGPMNIYEDAPHPWLAWEREYLTVEAAKDTPMLGICLGAQLLAHAHGGRVRRNPVPEIGWMPVDWLDVPNAVGAVRTVLHWHGDTFDLPQNAARLASSSVCQNQAYRIGRTLGLQFHLEAGVLECAAMIKQCGNELAAVGPTVHTVERIQADALIHAGPARNALFAVLDWHFLGE